MAFLQTSRQLLSQVSQPLIQAGSRHLFQVADLLACQATNLLDDQALIRVGAQLLHQVVNHRGSQVQDLAANHPDNQVTGQVVNHPGNQAVRQVCIQLVHHLASRLDNHHQDLLGSQFLIQRAFLRVHLRLYALNFRWIKLLITHLLQMLSISVGLM